MEEKLKRIGVTFLVIALAAVATRVAVADNVTYQQVSTTQIRKDLTLRPPPLVLPDIAERVRKLSRADRKWLAPQLRKSQSVIRFFENPEHRWVIAPRKEKCWHVPWQRQCTLARAKLRLNHALAEVAERRLTYELPLINDWLLAVNYVCTKIYPGTCSALRFLSDREGGWGRWVWYSGACSDPPCLWRGYHVGGDNVTGDDTVGGWMQFRYSTFAPYWRHTLANLKQRGFIVPYIPMPPEGGDPRYAAWLSPLGQALTAGYMHWSGRAGCHWCL